MSKFYQVYQAHSPSGGISAVDDTRYATLEEARGAAEALASGVSEFRTYVVGNKEYTFPAFWAQSMREHKGVIVLELE